MKLVPGVGSSDLDIPNTTEAEDTPPDSWSSSTGRQPAFKDSNKITGIIGPDVYCPLLSENNLICRACNEYRKNINNGEISPTDAQKWLVKQHKKLMECVKPRQCSLVL